MIFPRANLNNCSLVRGTVVVIDVVRAFTTAAYAFAAGASEIIPTGTIEEAYSLKEQYSGSLLMGEVGGKPPPGFDLGNSPSALIGMDLHCKRLIQRTSAGTQGIVLASQADQIWVSSFVCASATAQALLKFAISEPTFIITYGDEDEACADYLESLLNCDTPDPQPFLERVRLSREGLLFSNPDRPEFPASDLDCCTSLDQFDFAMRVERRDNLYVMRQFDPSHMG